MKNKKNIFIDLNLKKNSFYNKIFPKTQRQKNKYFYKKKENKIKKNLQVNVIFFEDLLKNYYDKIFILC